MVVRQRLLAAACAVVALICVLPARAMASGTQETILMDDTHLIYSSPKVVARTLQQLASLGVDRVKVSVVWSLVAPQASSRHRPKFKATNPGAYPTGAWDRYDLIVKLARALGMKVYFIIIPPVPTWAIDHSMPVIQSKPLGRPPTPGDFRAFVQAVGNRYNGNYVDPGGGASSDSQLQQLLPGVSIPGSSSSPPTLPRVSYWGIWNEPNFPSWLNPWYRTLRDGVQQETQPVIYRNLANAAWTGLNASGHAGDTIVLGETAKFGIIPSIPFAEALYCVNGGFHSLRGKAAESVGCPTSPNKSRFVQQNPGLFQASAWGHHPYALDQAPNHAYPNSGVALYNLGALEGTLNGIFSSYGRRPAGGVPMVVSEWGYKTDPPDPLVTTNLVQQAAWLDEGDYMTWREPWVHGIAQFLLYDSAPDRHYPSSNYKHWGPWMTGLEFDNGTHKPAFDAFRLPIWMPHPHHGSGVTVWGQLRPANHSGFQYAQIQFQPRGSRNWTAVTVIQTSNPEGYFQNHVPIPSAGNVRYAWSSPSGTLYYSRTVSVT